MQHLRYLAHDTGMAIEPPNQPKHKILLNELVNFCYRHRRHFSILRRDSPNILSDSQYALCSYLCRRRCSLSTKICL